MIIDKSDRLAHVRYDIRGPISREAERMEREGIKIIKLNTGNPAAFGFEAPPYAPQVIGENLALTAAYSDSQGLWEAREAIARYCAGKGIEGVRPEDVYTGNGVSELIQMSAQALLNPGDEILIPAPDYPLWTAAATMAGGRVVHYRCDERADWLPDIADIRRNITPNTRAIVVINPNNPTGALYPDDLLREIVKLAREHELLIFSDEIYDRLVMDGLTHTSTAALAPDLPVVTMGGLSKSHQLCGFRCGWMAISGDKAGAEGFIDGLTTLSSMRLCANVPAQAMIRPALEDLDFSKATLLSGGRLFEQRDFAHRALNSIPGVSAVRPKAALYIFPRIDTERYRIRDDGQFVLDFLRESHVLLTHGGSYSWREPDHFRFVYLPALSELEEVFTRLRAFLEQYRQY